MMIQGGARWPCSHRARCTIAAAKQKWSIIGWVTKFFYFEPRRASAATLSQWSRLYLHSLAPTNPHWARVVGYYNCLFSLCVIHKEGLCPSSGDINRLMMMMINFGLFYHVWCPVE
jgi:hypothetical protein